MPKENVIKINVDAKCKQCGKEGATQSGYCLDCLNKQLLQKPLVIALGKIPEIIENLIVNHGKDLEEAWENAEDLMTINFSAKIGIANGKKIGEVSISFTKDKIKDTSQFSWDERQLSMPLK